MPSNQKSNLEASSSIQVSRAQRTLLLPLLPPKLRLAALNGLISNSSRKRATLQACLVVWWENSAFQLFEATQRNWMWPLLPRSSEVLKLSRIENLKEKAEKLSAQNGRVRVRVRARGQKNREESVILGCCATIKGSIISKSNSRSLYCCFLFFSSRRLTRTQRKLDRN